MVDFPDPLGPMIASFSPPVTFRSKSCRIWVLPYHLLTPMHWMIGKSIGDSGRSNFALQATEKQRGGVTNYQEKESHHRIRLRIAVSHPSYLPRGT
jgi:hypothetical protein